MTLITILIALGQSVSGLSEPLMSQDPESGTRALASQRRLVRHFDFEAAGIQGRVPGAWARLVDRPGYPKFGSVGVDGGFACEGDYSLRFNVDGGSMAVGIRAGEIPIFPQSRYLVTAQVRTQGLMNSGARLAVTLHDAEGRPIAGTERLSEVVRTDGVWTTIAVEPPLDVEIARDLVFELRVEQPGAGPEDLPRHVDVSGSAWFDDVEIWQLPRIEFRSEPPSGVTRFPQAPRLSASLRDLVHGQTVATIRVNDVDGITVLEERIAVDGGHSAFALDLAPLQPGWYLGTFEVHDADRVVARSEQPIAILQKRETPAFGRRTPAFGVSLWPKEKALDSTWQEMLVRLEPDYVVLPVWEGRRSSALTHHEQDTVDQILDVLFDARIEPVFELAEVPTDLAKREHLDPGQLTALLANAPNVWKPALDPWMLQFGDEVSRWRLRSEAFESPRLRRQVAEAVLDFSKDFVAAPRIEMTGNPGEIATGSPVHSIPPESDGLSSDQSMTDTYGADLTLQFPVWTEAPSPRARGEELANRLVNAWARGVSRIEITPPWQHLERTPGSTSTGLVGMDVTGFVFEHFIARFSGRPPEAEVPLGRGVRAILAGGSGAPTLVAWSEEPSSEGLQVGLGLGTDRIRISDFLGDVREIDISPGMTPIFLGEAPVLIEGIDPDLARFRAGARLVPETVGATTGTHDLELELYNPWSRAIDLKVRSTGPATWEFQPKHRRVAIEPGERARIPFSFNYPRSQIDGDVDFWFEVEFLGDSSQTVQLLIPSKIESPNVSVESTWRLSRDDSGRLTGFIVTIRAYNTGTESLNFEAFATARGFPPMRKWMPELPPGANASRSFMFVNGHEELLGQDILVGISEFDGSTRITRRIQLPSQTGSVVGVDPNGEE
jgi:hypothetical protein